MKGHDTDIPCVHCGKLIYEMRGYWYHHKTGHSLCRLKGNRTLEATPPPEVTHV